MKRRRKPCSIAEAAVAPHRQPPPPVAARVIAVSRCSKTLVCPNPSRIDRGPSYSRRRLHDCDAVMASGGLTRTPSSRGLQDLIDYLSAGNDWTSSAGNCPGRPTARQELTEHECLHPRHSSVLLADEKALDAYERSSRCRTSPADRSRGMKSDSCQPGCDQEPGTRPPGWR